MNPEILINTLLDEVKYWRTQSATAQTQLKRLGEVERANQKIADCSAVVEFCNSQDCADSGCPWRGTWQKSKQSLEGRE